MSDFRKILISGADGFIGSHLVRTLVDTGFSVGILEHTSCQFSRLGDVLSRVEVFRFDIRDFPGIVETCRSFKPEALIHLATRYAVRHSPDDFEDMVQTNVIGSLNLLEAAAMSGVRLFLNTSSCFVYAPSSAPIHEDAALKPMNLYALTKLQTEEACSHYAENRGLGTWTFRLFPPYGPADHPRRLIPHVIRCFQTNTPLRLTSGQQRWDFIEVTDIVQAYIRALERPVEDSIHRIVNIGSGTAIRLRHVVNTIRRIMRTDQEPEWGAIPHRENERMVLEADISRARTLLDWSPRMNLEDGLAAAIDWFKHRAPD